MTKQEIDEAIDILKTMHSEHDGEQYVASMNDKALKLAVKALEQMEQLEDAKGELPRRLEPEHGMEYEKGANNMLDRVTPIYLKVVSEMDSLKEDARRAAEIYEYYIIKLKAKYDGIVERINRMFPEIKYTIEAFMASNELDVGYNSQLAERLRKTIKYYLLDDKEVG